MIGDDCGDCKHSTHAILKYNLNKYAHNNMDKPVSFKLVVSGYNSASGHFGVKRICTVDSDYPTPKPTKLPTVPVDVIDSNDIKRGSYIPVNIQLSYDEAQQYCLNNYQTTLAVINNYYQNKKATELCQSIHSRQSLNIVCFNIS